MRIAIIDKFMRRVGGGIQVSIQPPIQSVLTPWQTGNCCAQGAADAGQAQEKLVGLGGK